MIATALASNLLVIPVSLCDQGKLQTGAQSPSSYLLNLLILSAGLPVSKYKSAQASSAWRLLAAGLESKNFPAVPPNGFIHNRVMSFRVFPMGRCNGAAFFPYLAKQTR